MKLVGDGIYVRFLEESDAAAKLELFLRNRAFFETYSTTRTEEFYTMDYQLSSIISSDTSMENSAKYEYGVFLNNSNDLIGVISLTEVVRGSLQSCWLGYFLDKAHNGRGFTTEAVRLVISHAFDVLKLHRIEAGVMPHNAGSIRVLEKTGFEKEGLSKKNVLINGKWEDHLHFAIVSTDD